MPTRPTDRTPVSSKQGRDSVVHLRDAGGQVDLAERAVYRVEVGADAKRRKPAAARPSRKQRLEPAEVPVLGTDGGRDHPADGRALASGAERSARRARTEPALEELLGDPCLGILVAA